MITIIKDGILYKNDCLLLLATIKAECFFIELYISRILIQVFSWDWVTGTRTALISEIFSLSWITLLDSTS
ncbi:hypothetical protein F8M41_010972 [Gigaspora margarita]|uniref:Uncharacterized protein n=1 Tax=Gigaspora margarita TaxID=4874 RepID=A0A8H4AU30_GIGMA|nr:hypothetical protein F8M41_010972 [Gigaspora margarita]